MNFICIACMCLYRFSQRVCYAYLIGFLFCFVFFFVVVIEEKLKQLRVEENYCTKCLHFSVLTSTLSSV